MVSQEEIERRKEQDRVRKREQYAADPEKYKLRSKNYRSANVPTCKARSANYRQRNLEALKAKDKAYRKEHPTVANAEYHLAFNRRKKYGITSAEWDTLFTKQGKKCAICRADEPGGKFAWHTDHCHDTKRVRGILCHNCNHGLGMFRDDVARLRTAINYLTCEGNFNGEVT